MFKSEPKRTSEGSTADERVVTDSAAAPLSEEPRSDLGAIGGVLFRSAVLGFSAAAGGCFTGSWYENHFYRQNFVTTERINGHLDGDPLKPFEFSVLVSQSGFDSGNGTMRNYFELAEVSPTGGLVARIAASDFDGSGPRSFELYQERSLLPKGHPFEVLALDLDDLATALERTPNAIRTAKPLPFFAKDQTE